MNSKHINSLLKSYDDNKYDTKEYPNYINLAIENKQIINPVTLKKFLKKIFNFTPPRSRYYNSNSRLNIITNREKYIPTITNIFKTYPDICDEHLIKNILHFPIYDDSIIHLNLNMATMIMITQRLSSNYNINNNTILEKCIIKNIDLNNFDHSIIKHLCKCKSDTIAIFVANIIDKIQLDNTTEVFNVVYNNLPYSKPIILSLINKGCIITNQHILDVIHIGDIESIKFIMEIANSQNKLTLSKEYFNVLMSGSKTCNGNVNKCSILDTYILDDDNDIECMCSGDCECIPPYLELVVLQLDENYEYHTRVKYPLYDPKILELFVEYGYVIDKDDVMLSIKHKHEIPNIESYVTLDEEFLRLCHDHNFYPNYDFKCIPKELLELQKLCNIKRLPSVRAHIKKHKIVPDSICMENACKIKNNDKIIQLLVDSGGVVTAKCFEEYGKAINDKSLNIMAKNLIDKTNIVKKIEIQNQ